ncbi:hypothetical protein C1H76_4724 [Elsinoe australis]|uniref:Uncharacterized protein n=1 Tax=Elsinoe australis TaxID=40998 RepID=A0A4V6DUD0_9PEZI|nr:hypothetical protein C1H76_4724 [Elsinoe australis]
MERVLNALEGDKQLQFWGISYGTVLGATFAAMFPDRVKRMVLDGVVNVYEYYNYQQIEFWTDTDNVFNDFCATCVAHPNTCALANKSDVTAAQLRHSILQIIARLEHHPVTVPVGNDVVVVDHLFAKALIFRNLYDPAGWPHLAKIISIFIEKEPIPAGMSAFFIEPEIENEYLIGILCSDSSWRASRRSELTPIIQAGRRLSIFAESSDIKSYACARWPFVAKDRPDRSAFDSVLTAHPVLFVGNTHDPVTPLKSAFNVSQGFSGSVVLQQNSTGHGSTSSFSHCTHRMLRQYFATGGLPRNDTICQIDVQPFAQVSLSGTAKRDLFSTAERGF